MKSKGMTLIEIIICVALISIVMIFVSNILVDMKNENTLSSKRSTDAINRATIIRIIQNDFITYELSGVATCNKSGSLFCYLFEFEDAYSKVLAVYPKYLVYDDEIWELSDYQSYVTDNARFCFKNDVSALGEVSAYHFLKIVIPTTSNTSSNRKYDIELTHVSDKVFANNAIVPSSYKICD